ncbi:peptidase S16, lon domain protein [Galbibacter orientalis DSM 19592]|uniref:Peptidase S16, lon domain protein n=2 Tax=Galbibacter TaxID=379068 RepID=I3CB01_9FLAO|nr:peptidase S16, lon domain protein [Galbibacter orientalis DSM 19592]
MSVMNRIIPLFPLQIVVFPTEVLPLHIFEERYKQLINDCKRRGLNFGIPTFLEGKLSYGTEVKLEEIVKNYDNGSMDILCKGIRTFKVDKFFNPIPNKLYAGGEVQFFENKDDSTLEEYSEVIALIKQLYAIIGVSAHNIQIETFNSFLFAHKIGMSIGEEYQLLEIVSEWERVQFIKAHLLKVLPILNQVNDTRKLIQMNGHFKNLDPLKF